MSSKNHPKIAAVKPVCSDLSEPQQTKWHVEDAGSMGKIDIRTADGKNVAICGVKFQKDANEANAALIVEAVNFCAGGLNADATKLVGKRIAELEKQNAGLLAALEDLLEGLDSENKAAPWHVREGRAAIASAKGGVQS